MPETAEMEVVSEGPLNLYRLKFPQVHIEWRLPVDMPPTPFGINWAKLGTDCDVQLLADVTYRRGRFAVTVRKGYEYDGASIPRIIRWAPGYQRIGRHLWAATLHDWIIDDERKPLADRDVDLPRVVADAIFITLLLDTGVDQRQSRWMYRAVRAYSMWRAWQYGPETAPILTAATKEAAKAPVTKAAAVAEAAEVAKAETSVPPCPEKQCNESTVDGRSN